MADIKVKKIPKNNRYTAIGWREWVYLPTYKNFALKAKVDTGARTSALHATNIKEFEKKGEKWVRFKLHQNENHKIISSRLIKHKKITNSFGDTEIRPVIKMKIKIGQNSWSTEITLTARSRMTYPMLIGRNSLMKKHLIHSHKSYMTGKNNFHRS